MLDQAAVNEAFGHWIDDLTGADGSVDVRVWLDEIVDVKPWLDEIPPD